MAAARQLVADLLAQLPTRCSSCLAPASAFAHSDLGPGNVPMGGHPYVPSAPIEDLRRRAAAFLEETQ